jgi:Flp pilus assembly protein TadD
MPDAVAASRWIKEAEPMLADDNEQLVLGEAWYRLAVRTNAPGALDAAAKAIDVLVAKPQPAPEAMLMRAMIADRAGDSKAAEINYRRTLKLKPQQPEALNNLAYTLLINGGDLQEARALATKAVELQPGTASFRDTLARVQLKCNERDAAVATFKKAIELEPKNLEAMIGLAGALLDSGQRDSAINLMSRIDELLKSKPPMTPELRRELETVRATAKASA